MKLPYDSRIIRDWGGGGHFLLLQFANGLGTSQHAFDFTSSTRKNIFRGGLLCAALLYWTAACFSLTFTSGDQFTNPAISSLFDA